MNNAKTALLLIIGMALGITISEGYTATNHPTANPIEQCEMVALGEIEKSVKTDRDSSALLNRAVSGDADAAITLAASLGKVDFSRMMYMERIGAENGNPASQYSYGKWLTESDSDAVKARGKFWLQKAKLGGVKEADSYLRSASH